MPFPKKLPSAAAARAGTGAAAAATTAAVQRHPRTLDLTPSITTHGTWMDAAGWRARYNRRAPGTQARMYGVHLRPIVRFGPQGVTPGGPCRAASTPHICAGIFARRKRGRPPLDKGSKGMSIITDHAPPSAHPSRPIPTPSRAPPRALSKEGNLLDASFEEPQARPTARSKRTCRVGNVDLAPRRPRLNALSAPPILDEVSRPIHQSTT